MPWCALCLSQLWYTLCMLPFGLGCSAPFSDIFVLRINKKKKKEEETGVAG